MKNILILVVSLIIVSFLNMNSYGQDNHKSCSSDEDHSSCIEKTCLDNCSSTKNDSNSQDNHKSCSSDEDHSSCTEKTSSHDCSSTINNSGDVSEVHDVTALVCSVSKKEIEEGKGVKFNYLGK